MFYLDEPVGVPWSPPRGGDVQVVAPSGDGHLRLLVAIASSPQVGEAHGAEPWNIFRIDFFPSNFLYMWVARYSFETGSCKELGLGPATISRLILKLCSTVQQSRPIEADWADWDLFPFSSKLLYRYLSVHLSHLYKPISRVTTKTLTSTYTLLTQLHLGARLWPLIATLTSHSKFLLKSRALNMALQNIMHWL